MASAESDQQLHSCESCWSWTKLADLLKIEIVLVEVALSVTEDFLGILKLLEILFYTPLIVVEDTNITETSFDLPWTVFSDRYWGSGTSIPTFIPL